MLVKILGAIDLIAAILLVLNIFNIVPLTYLLPFALYLIIKALIFVIGKDFASMIDLLIGIAFLLVFFKISIPTMVLTIAVFWLVQKAFFSFFS